MDPDCTAGSSRGVAVLVTRSLCTCGKEKEGMNLVEGLDLSTCWVSQHDSERNSYWLNASMLQDNAITNIAALWDKT